MKNIQILFLTFLMFLFFSCEVPMEKPTMEEKEEVKVKTSADSTKSNIKKPVSIEDIYKMYGCLNMDNLIPDGLDNDGKHKFILIVKGKYFYLNLVCDSNRCWLSDENGKCRTRLRIRETVPNIPNQVIIPKTYDYEFSCYDLYDPNSYYNKRD